MHGCNVWMVFHFNWLLQSNHCACNERSDRQFTTQQSANIRFCSLVNSEVRSLHILLNRTTIKAICMCDLEHNWCLSSHFIFTWFDSCGDLLFAVGAPTMSFLNHQREPFPREWNTWFGLLYSYIFSSSYQSGIEYNLE